MGTSGEQGNIRRHLLISGRVQGVGFRYFTAERARARGLAGWVRNLADGRVEAEVEGPAPSVEALITDLKKGPALSRVDSLRVKTVECAGIREGFDIRSTSY